MCFILFWLTLACGLWVVIYILVPGNAGPVMLGLVVAGGILTILLSAVNIRLQPKYQASHQGSATARPKSPAWDTGANVAPPPETGKTGIITGMRWGLVAAGVFLIIVGIWYVPNAAAWNSLGTGIAVTLLGGLATQISPHPATVNLFNRDGSVLLEASQVEWQGGNIIIKGKVLNSLSTSAHLKAEEAWKALSLISPSIIMHLPLFLYRGWRANRRRGK